MGELTSLSATEMAEGIRRKKFSATELTEAHLRRIGRVNPKINAFVTVDEARGAGSGEAGGIFCGAWRMAGAAAWRAGDGEKLDQRDGISLRDGNTVACGGDAR